MKISGSAFVISVTFDNQGAVYPKSLLVLWFFYIPFSMVKRYISNIDLIDLVSAISSAHKWNIAYSENCANPECVSVRIHSIMQTRTFMAAHGAT
uniref:Uncharacterized protein n=1 Tax=Candidatus Kentrum sp. MB TaxID=2138164 RepID=A0A451BC62_9GAMM|nr:MAG: hypothetical protein BECKMB1821I_GA0114274_102527 [Candidatus Kentron sp. MB]VFK75871.1 MAG: hypothetical protein BECKMB1821H_GA0114242_103411 [Candidatus Kentron sp. MB]